MRIHLFVLTFALADSLCSAYQVSFVTVAVYNDMNADLDHRIRHDHCGGRLLVQ